MSGCIAGMGGPAVLVVDDDEFIRDLVSSALRIAGFVIGVPAVELRRELAGGATLAGGSTLAEVAEANGVDPAAVVDALLARARDRVTALIEGAGRRAEATAS